MAEKKAARKATGAANPATKPAPRPGPREGNSGGEAAVLGKIAAMPDPYRAMGERLHTLILRNAPALQPAVWYGMPGYAKDGNTACFFRADQKYMSSLIESAWYFAVLEDGNANGGASLRHRRG